MSRYPLAIKWVIGQVALGKDINLALGDLTSSTGDVARFCFDHIFKNLLNEEPRNVLYALAANETPLSRGILSHVTNMPADQLDEAIHKLTIASLVIPTQLKSENSGIETRYELLPLTRNYIFAQLQIHPRIYQEMKSRMHQVENLLEEADRAGKQYRYSLRDMGAETNEEKIAATWAVTGYQKFQTNDYDGAVEAFTRGAQIAPNFAAIYRNWATVESDAGFYHKANELMRKAATLSPIDSRVWFVWGNIEKRQGHLDDACEYIQKAIDLSPNDGFLMGAKGEVEKRRGNYEIADSLLLKALELKPKEGPRRRHEIICLTSLADNNQRWAEALTGDQRSEEAGGKLLRAFEYGSKAAELGKDDYLAQVTLREVCLNLGYYYLRTKNFSEARNFFEKTLVGCTKKIKDRKLTERACLHLADLLLGEGKKEEAKHYFTLGRKAVIEGGKYSEKYKALSAEFAQERIRGKVTRVFRGKGYGFILTDQPTPQEVFLHITKFLSDITTEDFEMLVGETLSFLLDKSDTGKAPAAIRVTIVKN
jgi:tetratricopeptide (TPR) repeat protein